VPENPSDALAVSQLDLVNNFMAIYNGFLVNHVALDAASNAGNHTYIQLIELDDDPQTGPSNVSLYVKKVDGQTDQLFLRLSGNGSVIQISNYQIYSITPTPTQNSYFTFLPGKIIAYFGNFTSLPNNTLNLIPPVATNIMTVSFCPTGTTAGYKPVVSLVAPATKDDFYTSIKVTANPLGAPVVASYYLVLANF
jgi:hypothetical protein